MKCRNSNSENTTDNAHNERILLMMRWRTKKDFVPGGTQVHYVALHEFLSRSLSLFDTKSLVGALTICSRMAMGHIHLKQDMTRISLPRDTGK